MSETFLSKTRRRERDGCESGTVTVYDRGYGVLGEGEIRGVGLCCPGGYLWRPALGQRVLVVKTGPGPDTGKVIGAEQAAAPVEPEAGEVCIYSPTACVWLKNDGSIQLRGTVDVVGLLRVNGLPVTGGGQ